MNNEHLNKGNILNSHIKPVFGFKDQKREELKKLLNDNGIDIMCLQETEIESEYTREMLNIRTTLLRPELGFI